MSLEEPAVEEEPQRFRFEQMLAAGDFARTAEKGEFHRVGGDGSEATAGAEVEAA